MRWRRQQEEQVMGEDQELGLGHFKLGHGGRQAEKWVFVKQSN